MPDEISQTVIEILLRNKGNGPPCSRSVPTPRSPASASTPSKGLEVIFALEDRFSISIPDEDAGRHDNRGRDGGRRRAVRGTSLRQTRHQHETGGDHRAWAPCRRWASASTRFWSGLLAARSGVRRITLLRSAARSPVPIAAEVPDFDPRLWMWRPSEIDAMDRFSQFAVVAAGEALRASGLSAADLSEAHAGVAVGSAAGRRDHGRRAIPAALRRRSISRPHPFTIPRLMNSAAASHLTMCYAAGWPGAELRHRVRRRDARDRRGGGDHSRGPRRDHARRRRRRAHRATA